MTSPDDSLLVVSAHAGDFVWRAGGAIALTTARGGRATVVCLSYSERGESRRHAPGRDQGDPPGRGRGRNAGPNLGLPDATKAEAYLRHYPQATGRLN